MTRRRQWRPPPRGRFFAAVLLAAVVPAVLAAPAVAKEDVEATLSEPLPLDAAPGDEITVTWTLTYEDEAGEVQPFGAQGVYVTLVSATSAEHTSGNAGDDVNGRYEAAVTAPEGGIGGIQIALMGWANAEPAPVAFPIVNNTLPALTGETLLPVAAVEAPSPAAPPSTAKPDSRAPAIWIGLGLAALLALAFLALLVRRRRHQAATV